MNGKEAKKIRKEARRVFMELFGNICNDKFWSRLKLAFSIMVRRDYFAGTGKKFKRTKEQK